MPAVLLLFAHPALEKSRVHRRLIAGVTGRDDVTFHDLYEAYPDYDIDVGREQDLLVRHEVIAMQHPFFWYSVPPLLKQWIDLVLEHGWAYGSEGTALRGKRAMSIITTGGAAEAYRPGGYNRYTIPQLLAPVEQTFRLCGVDYLEPYLIQGVHRMTIADIEKEVGRYASFLSDLVAGATKPIQS